METNKKYYDHLPVVPNPRNKYKISGLSLLYVTLGTRTKYLDTPSHGCLYPWEQTQNIWIEDNLRISSRTLLDILKLLTAYCLCCRYYNLLCTKNSHYSWNISCETLDDHFSTGMYFPSFDYPVHFCIFKC